VVVVQAETLLVKMVARAVVVGVDIKLLEVLEIHHQPVHPKEITVGQEMLLVVGTVAVVEVEQGRLVQQARRLEMAEQGLLLR
jgi:hypothetical protein